MNFARFSVNRPVTILMGMLATIVLGILAWGTLKVDLLPDITFPVITVITLYPGAGPQEVEEYITKPIEEQCGLVRNLKHLSSSSQEGVSIVSEEFDWGGDMDFASFDTREKVDQVVDRLPDDAKRPYIVKMDPQTVIPIMTLNVSGMDDQEVLRKFTEDFIKRDLEKVEGVAAMDVYGGLQREIQVLVDRDRLSAYNVSVQEIEGALKAENLNIPGGHIELGQREFTVRTVGEFKTPQEIANITIGSRDNIPIRLADIATISDTHKDVRQYSRLDRKPSVTLVVRKESGANAVETAHGMRREVEALNKRLPGQIRVTETYASADSIERSLHNMYGVAEEGAILAVIVIFLFLSSLRSTLVIATSLPLSILVTAIAMKFHNMTLNIITLGGLTLAIGRIVDDSIVVIENVFHHVEAGESPYRAAVKGAGEVGMAIIAATLTTVCVFLPLTVVGGLVGVFFTPLALTVTIALLSSLVVALTVIPMVAARLLRPRTEAEAVVRNPLLKAIYDTLAAWERAYLKVEATYGHAVAWCLQHRALVTGLALGIFLFSASLVPLLGGEFFPTTDQGEFQLSLQMPVGVNVDSTNRAAVWMEDLMLKTPEITMVTSTVGESGSSEGSGSVRNASFQVKLKNAKERSRTTDEVIAEVREKFKALPGAKVSFATGMGGGAAPFVVTISGDDIPDLARIGQEALDKLKKVPGLVDLRLSWERGAPEYEVVIDRQKAGLYGLSTAQIAGTVRSLVRGTETTKYREGGKEYDITVRLPAPSRTDIRQIQDITLPGRDNAQVPFGQVAKIVETLGPTQVDRYEQRRSIDILGDLSHDRPLDAITRDADAILTAIPKPVGYGYQYRGDEQNRRESFSGFFIAIALGILLIYLILASQFESIIQPMIIMLAIPLEAIGAFAALLITHTTISMMVLMGLLLLTGIVVSNSILLVQVVNVMKGDGASTTDALIRGGRRRLRPILMTAIATLLAMLPMALALREGSGMWRPLGITVIGGLFSSTFLTLLVVPVAYSLVDDLAHKLGFRSAVSTHPVDTDDAPKPE